MDLFSFPHFVGFCLCCGSKKINERQRSMSHADHRLIRILVLNQRRGFFCIDSGWGGRGKPSGGAAQVTVALGRRATCGTRKIGATPSDAGTRIGGIVW